MSRSSTYLAPGNVAVITGASSGIGRAAARHCAKVGMKVFLADIDEAELNSAVAEVAALAKGGVADVKGVKTNVSDPASVGALKDVAFAATGEVHFLMNNAGVGTGGGALDPLTAWEKTIGVNTWGPIHGCQAFIPAMKATGKPGLIVNTGSKQGITMPPGNLAYNVSKAALKAYTEGLEHELRSDKEGKLCSALLVPGWVNTSIVAKTIRSKNEAEGKDFKLEDSPFHEGKPAGGAWMPDQIVDFMIAELDKGRFYIMCPDNDVDRETDNLRMTWAMQDITQDRPPLSRWHPEYKDAFTAFVAENKKG